MEPKKPESYFHLLADWPGVKTHFSELQGLCL